MKILIIEDEARAANQLIKLLDSIGFDYTLLDQLDSIEESVEWFQNHAAPELIFMDIQLADGLSFEIFNHTKVTSPIIFTTAFDEYAIKAFKVNSVDYLLKPIKKEDLNTAIDKFKSQQKSQIVDPFILKSMLQSMQTSAVRSGILVKEGSGFIHLQLQDLCYAYAEDGLCFAMTTTKRYMLNETIDHLMASIDAGLFYRINRGQIVAKGAVLRVDPYFNHRVKLKIMNGKTHEFIVSRQKTTDFKDWLNR